MNKRPIGLNQDAVLGAVLALGTSERISRGEKDDGGEGIVREPRGKAMKNIAVLILGFFLLTALSSGFDALAQPSHYENIKTTTFRDNSNPILAGSYDTPGSARGVEVSGNLALAADGSSGLQVISLFAGIGDIQYYHPQTGIPMSPQINQEVTVEGVVYAVKGTLTQGGFYIQDLSGGINYFSPNADGIAIGDTIRATATVFTYEGEIYLHDSEVPTVEILGSGPEPEPRDYTVASLISDYENVGWFVRVSGTISDLNTNGFILNQDADAVMVHVSDLTGIDLSHFQNGSSVTIQGACVIRNGEIQVWPRYQTDFDGGGDPTTLYVATTGSDMTGDGTEGNPYVTIQKAIDLSFDLGEVWVQPGTYTGPGNRDIDFLGKAITVRSCTGDPATAIIDCQGTEAEPHRGFIFQNDEGAESVLMGFTVTGGFADGNGGGGILLNGGYPPDAYDGASPTVSNCEIVNNSGGGLSVKGSAANPTFTDCKFNYNIGYGFEARYASCNFVECQLDYNTWAGIWIGWGGHEFTGGSISSNGSSGLVLGSAGFAQVIGCVIDDNGGSGIWMGSEGHATVRDCDITNNSGAGIESLTHFTAVSVFSSRINFNGLCGVSIIFDLGGGTIQDSELIGNGGWGVEFTLGESQKGLKLPAEYNVTIDNCLIALNEGGGLGGIIYDYSVIIANSIISDNRGDGINIHPYNDSNLLDIGVVGTTIADNDGRGIYSRAGSFTLQNSLIANNLLESVTIEEAVTITISCSDIYGNVGGDWIGFIAPQFGGGNISLDPQFCGVANVSDPYTLNHDSPCAAENNPDCGQIGAKGVGCSDETAQLTIDPTQGGPLNCDGTSVLNFDYTPVTDTAPLKGYSIRVVAESGVAFSASDFAVNILPPGDQVYFDFIENGVNDYTLAYAILGTETGGITTPESLFSVTFHGVEDGAAVVSIPEAEFRDLVNVSIPVDYSSQATIAVDCGPPAAVIEVLTLPRHEGIAVTWNDPPDPDLSAVLVYRGLWHDGSLGSVYPGYGLVEGNMVPMQFPTHADYMVSDEWELAGTVDVGVGEFVDSVVTRGIYFYQLFAIDTAQNASIPLVDSPAATNYILGDVAVPYDGEVGVADLSVLGDSFGVGCGHQYFNAEVDIGPTEGGSANDIPIPDCFIDFEDLMIFAIAFGSPAPAKTHASGGSDLILSWVQHSDLEWSCILEDPCPELKGIHFVGNGPGVRDAQIELGTLLAVQPGPVFLQKAESQNLDVGLAVLGDGQGIEGVGELFRVYLSAPVETFNATIEARNTANVVMEYQLLDHEIKALPTRFALDANYPNPFNPLTTICYNLPEARQVNLRIYSIDGRQVRTLVSDLKQAGSYHVVWDGRDDGNRGVASGIYFCRFEAGSYSAMQKMVLMK